MLRGRRLGHEDRVLIWEITSAMLRYPSAELVAALPAIAAAAAELRPALGGPIAALAESRARRDIVELQAEYVELFDLARRCSLYLSWHQYGDRRQRGMVLLRLKRQYAEHGFAPVTDELPDWLPLALEFAARTPDGAGLQLLEQWRAPIELIRRGLHESGDESAVLLDAVSATLPRLGSDMQSAVEQLLRDGPPDEEVGLSPFGPDGDPAAMLPPSGFENQTDELSLAGRAI